MDYASSKVRTPKHLIEPVSHMIESGANRFLSGQNSRQGSRVQSCTGTRRNYSLRVRGLKDYEVQDKLGEGSYGCAFKVRDITTGQFYVMK